MWDTLLVYRKLDGDVGQVIINFSVRRGPYCGVVFRVLVILGDGTEAVVYDKCAISNEPEVAANIHIRDVADKLKREKLSACSGHTLKRARTRAHKRNGKKQRGGS
jgi:hypothetical protein